MSEKPKARGGQKKTGHRSAEEAQKEQSERFIETARAIGVDESGKEFDVAMKRLVPRKPGKKST
jgi:hypothetical protein